MRARVEKRSVLGWNKSSVHDCNSLNTIVPFNHIWGILYDTAVITVPVTLFWGGQEIDWAERKFYLSGSQDLET